VELEFTETPQGFKTYRKVITIGVLVCRQPSQGKCENYIIGNKIKKVDFAELFRQKINLPRNEFS